MSTPHLTKSDLQTDAVTMELKKGFQWTVAHTKATTTALMGFIALGLVYSGWKYMSDKKASSSQESYYSVEKEYMKKLASTQKATGLEAKATAPVVLDYDKDLSDIVKKFSDIVDADPSSDAAIMAALNISEIAAEYHKEDLALSTLSKIKSGSNLLSAMLLNAKATAQANKNDCKSAVESWAKILSLPQAAPIKSQILLKQAFCFESMNENTKAEENYNKVIADSKDGSLGKSAEKYLRLLKSKVN